MRTEEREARRGRRSVWPALGLAFGIVALLYCVGWLITGGRFSRQLARLKAQGEPVVPSDLVPKLKPGERNAADVYERAFALAPAQTLASLYPLWDTRALSLPQKYARAQAMLPSNQPYLELLEQASRIDRCAFQVDWDDDLNYGTPAPGAAGIHEFADMHMALSALIVQSELRAHEGDLDGALDSCGAMLRVADHTAQMPWPSGYRMTRRPNEEVQDDIQRVLAAGDPSPEACRRLFDQLGRQDSHAAWVRALQSERAARLIGVRWLERGGLFEEYRPRQPLGIARAAYPVVAKPVWNADKGRSLELMAAYIEAARRPWPEAIETAWRLDEQAKVVPDDPTEGWYRSAGYFLFERYGYSFWYAGRDAATAGALQVSLALKAYHHEHGTYPATLAELERAGWRLPRDPFSQQPYHYRRETSGFTVWSVGPDGRDDSGRGLSGYLTGRPKPGYDFAVRCPE